MTVAIEHVKNITIAKLLFTEILQGEKLGKLQLFFGSDVLDRYRETEGYKIIRTNTSGRVSKPAGWSLDFGISGEADSIIHTSVESFANKVPKTEHEHWFAHLINLPMSANFLKGVVRPGCLEDGDIRKWE